MRAFWLTWMWITRACILYSIAMIGLGIADGHAPTWITFLVCLAVVAGNAEFCRRQFNNRELEEA